jgi:outer membrane receptor protein involved in Fe transport
LKSDVLTNGKLRATYGQVSIMPSIYRGSSYRRRWRSESWGPAYDAAAYNGGFEQQFLGGKSLLKPEIKTEYEAGVELSFFNRLDLGNVLRESNKDNLVQADVNPSSSFARYGNLAQIENKGLEIDVNFAILRNSLKWNMSGTLEPTEIKLHV